MQPLKPSQKNDILANAPQAQPEEVEEYERLLAQRFMTDPDLGPAPQPAAAGRGFADRLTELYRKLFGKAP